MSNAKSNIFLNIISEYRDSGAKNAQKSLSGIESLANRVGKAVAGAFATQQIIQFGKSSVDAFTQANKQFTVMNQTLNNLGLNVGMTRLEDFFNKLEMQFGKDKSVLIPAFQTLINSTKSYTKSQELLNLALDVSAGTGKDLSLVALALGKAYVGQTTSIVRLGIGYSAASIKGKSFLELQKELTASFSGSAAQAADTYQGKLDKLSVGYGNMKEAIGKGLIEGLTAAAGKTGDIDNLTKSMVKFGEETAKVLKFVGDLTGALAKVGSFFFSVKDNGKQKFSKYFGGDISKLTPSESYNPSLAKAAELQRQREAKQAALVAAAQAAASAKELATQKAIAAEKAKQLALQRAQAVLTIAGKILDIQQAEIAAAMANGSLTENELLRLQLKQALLNDNAKAAGEFAQQLINSQMAAIQLDASNPFNNWNTAIQKTIESLRSLQAELALAQKIAGMNTYYTPTLSVEAGTAYTSSTGQVPSSTNTLNGWYGYLNGLTAGLYGTQGVGGTTYAAPTVNVTVQGSVTTQQDLVNAITQGIYNNQASGIPINYSTTL